MAKRGPKRSNLDRLANATRLWRTRHLGLTQAEIAQKAGFNERTYRNIADGKPASQKTYYKLEKAFDWPRGTVQSILDGGPIPPIPTITPKPFPEPPPEEPDQGINALRLRAMDAELRACRLELEALWATVGALERRLNEGA